jgi:hypothetical protein
MGDGMKTSDVEILMIPGYDNSEDAHWQRRWAEKLSTARVVEQPDWRFGSLKRAVDVLVEAVRAASRPIILVAHSAGVPLTLHAVGELKRLELAGKVVGAFLVSPPEEAKVVALDGMDPDIAPFPRDPLPFPSVVAGSANDPFSEQRAAQDLALDIGAAFSDAGEAGHINVASGHGPWPEGLMRFAGFLRQL